MKEIGVIKNSCFGLKDIKLKNPRERKASRGIVIRDDGKIALFNKKKKNLYKELKNL